jgi:hypothetical protein
MSTRGSRIAEHADGIGSLTVDMRGTGLNGRAGTSPAAAWPSGCRV